MTSTPYDDATTMLAEIADGAPFDRERLAVTLKYLLERSLILEAHLFDPDGAHGLPGWLPDGCSSSYFYPITWSRKGPRRLIAYLRVEKFSACTREHGLTQWWAFCVDTRLHRRAHNPHEIHEWTLYGNDPRDLMRRARVALDAGTSTV